MPVSEVAARLRERVAAPGRFWLTAGYEHGPWLEGTVSESDFLVWLKRPRRGPPLARARGEVAPTAKGCTVTVRLPTIPRIHGSVIALATLGWLTAMAIVVLDFTSTISLPSAPYVAAGLGISGAITLGLTLARAEADELTRQIEAVLRELEDAGPATFDPRRLARSR